MKVLHVTQNYYPSIGGSQHTIKKVSELLHENYGDEICVITSNSLYGPHRNTFKLITPQEEVINGVTVKRFAFARWQKPLIKFLAKLWSKVLKKSLPEFIINIQYGPVSASMRSAINNSECDVICASSVHYLFAQYPLWAKGRQYARPFVLYGALHLHEAGISKTYLQRIRHSDYYIANTSFEKEYLVAKGISEEKIKVIGTGTDILSRVKTALSTEDAKKRIGIDVNKVVVTFIGRQEVSKGVPVLLDALNYTPPGEAQLQFIIAGARGLYSAEIENFAAKTQNLTIATNISDEQKAEILQATDILVLPSTEESFGVVFIEAWAFKKPVIGAGIQAIASLISNGIDGLLFKPGDARDLAEKIAGLSRNKEQREKLGAEGFKKYYENYRWDVVVEKYRSVYKLAIENHKNKLHEI